MNIYTLKMKITMLDCINVHNFGISIVGSSVVLFMFMKEWLVMI